jgi:hypothetical protein
MRLICRTDRCSSSSMLVAWCRVLMNAHQRVVVALPGVRFVTGFEFEDQHLVVAVGQHPQ